MSEWHGASQVELIAIAHVLGFVRPKELIEALGRPDRATIESEKQPDRVDR